MGNEKYRKVFKSAREVMKTYFPNYIKKKDAERKKKLGKWHKK